MKRAFVAVVSFAIGSMLIGWLHLPRWLRR
jgi:hypothetical protein